MVFAALLCLAAISLTHASMIDENKKVTVEAKDINGKLMVLFSGNKNDFTHKFENNKIIVNFVEDTFVYNTSSITQQRDYVEDVQTRPSRLIIQFHPDTPLSVRKIKLKGKTGLEVQKLKRNEKFEEVTPIRKDSLDVSHTENEKETLIKFEWDSYTASAVFEKDSKIWFIFNKTTSPTDIEGIKTKHVSLTNFKIHNNSSNSTVISADFKQLDKNTNKLFYKTGFSWNFKISKSKIKPMDMRVLSKPYAAPHPRVEIEFEDNSVNPIETIDPTTGIKYLTVPSHESAIATLQKYSFVDFDIIPSIQGVVFQPRSDSIKLTLEEQLIKIEGAASLNIAPRVYTKRTEKFGEDTIKLNLEEFVEGYSSIISLRSFEVKDDSFNKKILMIRHLILKSYDDDKKKAKIYANLALFYMANGFYREALTILEIVGSLDKKLYNSYNIRLIHAVAHYLNNDFNKAYDITKKIIMVDVPINFRKEVRFWKAITSYMVSGSAAYLKSGDPMAVFTERDTNFLTEYNDKLIFEVMAAISLEQIKDNEFGKARKIFKIFEKLTLNDSDQNRLYALDATYFAAINKIDQAVEQWDKCIEDSSDLLNHVKCRYDKNKYLNNVGYIKAVDYINELEALSYLWHGDELQIEILQNLGQVYFDNKNYTKALRSWNKIVTYFPFTPIALSLSKTLGSTFVKLFLTDDLNHNLSHLDALNLFYEFENLVPLGDTGDEIVLKFIEHLRALDLLDRAIVILKHQVTNRLYGYRKEEMINVLADMYMDNQEPAYAIDALELGDNYKILPDYIGKERKYITAKALYMNGDYDRAAALLKNDYSERADKIMAQVYWKQKKWKEFSKHIEPKVYKIRYKEQQLGAKETESVLKLAIAYLINNEWKLLDDLYRDFKNRMPEGDRNTEIFLTLEQSWKTIRERTLEANKTIDMIQETVDNIVSVIDKDSIKSKN